MAATRNQQEELRRLMREKMTGSSSTKLPTSLDVKSNSGSAGDGQQSPFAKVTSSGKLVCTICPGVPIKSWATHQISAHHKRSLTAHRTIQAAPPSQPKKLLSNKALLQEKTKALLAKEPSRSILKNPLVKLKPQQPPQQQQQQQAPAQHQHPETSEVQEKQSKIFSADRTASNGTSCGGDAIASLGLKRLASTSESDPKQDVGPSQPKYTKLEGDETAKGADTTLPEGFFDDPRLDAKARNQEYRDPKEVEWEDFQKTLREEETKSEQVVELDDEKEMRERQLYETEEMMSNWERVRELEIRKEELAKKNDPLGLTDSVETPVEPTCCDEDMAEDEPSSDNEEFSELLSWRQKSIKK